MIAAHKQGLLEDPGFLTGRERLERSVVAVSAEQHTEEQLPGSSRGGEGDSPALWSGKPKAQKGWANGGNPAAQGRNCLCLRGSTELFVWCKCSRA